MNNKKALENFSNLICWNCVAASSSTAAPSTTRLTSWTRRGWPGWMATADPAGPLATASLADWLVTRHILSGLKLNGTKFQQTSSDHHSLFFWFPILFQASIFSLPIRSVLLFHGKLFPFLGCEPGNKWSPDRPKGPIRRLEATSVIDVIDSSQPIQMS